MEVTLPHKYRPRDYQVPLWDAVFNKKYKRLISVWHRRSGKDVSMWNIIIRRAIENKGLHYYVLPTYAQGQRVIWEGITIDGTTFLDYIPPELIVGKPNNTDMKIELVNGSIIQVVGSDKFDSLRGTNGLTWVFSEYAYQNPQIWEVVKPILKVNGGVAIFNSTPNGDNHFAELKDIAKANPQEWFLEVKSIIDTQILNEDDMNAERRNGTPEHEINREYYCSFDEAADGAFYVDKLREAASENRICHGVYDKLLKVYTAWDIGYSDATAIVFYQLVGKEIRVVDYYEANGLTLPDYIKILRDKGYEYAEHVFPWDARIKPMTSGQSLFERAQAEGLKAVIAPNATVQEGIDKVRSIFPRLWFEKGTEEAPKANPLIKVLKNYKKQWDKEKKVFRKNPVHDWSSHGADAFRYMALSIQEQKPQEDITIAIRNYSQPEITSVASTDYSHDIMQTSDFTETL